MVRLWPDWPDQSLRACKGYGSSMWHTAPEVILYPGMYTKAVDVWSVGCIFAEMLSNEPIFPDSNHFNQLDRIFSVLGSPNEEDLISVENQASRLYVESLPFKERVSWNQLYPKENQETLSLLDGILAFNPCKRITVEQALTQPYLKTYHDPDDEPVCEPLIFGTIDDLPIEKVKDLLYEETIKFTK